MTQANEMSMIPRMATLPDGLVRPRWSVMVPTYNCANYLRQTLESVLAQDPGPDHMQIEVVDDASAKDDPASVVADVGHGRVGFFRQPENVGATRNFNSCVARSRGHLIHILHGDDYVANGFYRLVERMAERSNVACFATRAVYVDANSVRFGESERVASFERESRDATPFYFRTPWHTPGVVVRRSFYERWGGFREDLVHTADWEMWARAVCLGGGLMSSEALAFYRDFPENDTSRLKRTGENLQDRARLGAILDARHEDFDLRIFRTMIARDGVRQVLRFIELRDWAAVRDNAGAVWDLAPKVMLPECWFRFLIGAARRMLRFWR